jgi:hypothetical protein
LIRGCAPDPTRVKRLKAEIVRLNGRERVLMEEISGLREELSQLKKIDPLQEVRQSVRRTDHTSGTRKERHQHMRLPGRGHQRTSKSSIVMT